VICATERKHQPSGRAYCVLLLDLLLEFY